MYIFSSLYTPSIHSIYVQSLLILNYKKTRSENNQENKKKMASLITAATKVGHVRVAVSRRSTWNPRLFVAGAPRYIQVFSYCIVMVGL